MIPRDNIEIPMPALAHGVAQIAHRGQTDKAGAPYIKHLERVAHRLTGDKDKTIAYLHDILEDTTVTRSDLAALFPEKIVAVVELLSRRHDETYAAFIERICQSENFSAIAVKYADVTDHLQETSAIGSSLVDRYRKAEARLRDAVCMDVIKRHGSPIPA